MLILDLKQNELCFFCLNFVSGDLEFSHEWIRLSVRHPDEPVLDPRYLQQMNRSFYEFFVPWVKGERLDWDYRRMLKEQHRRATTDEIYWRNLFIWAPTAISLKTPIFLSS